MDAIPQLDATFLRIRPQMNGRSAESARIRGLMRRNGI
jgi:hypothetical protein